MADILIHSTVPSLYPQTESAANLLLDTPSKESPPTNKYNGHVTRLRNIFTDQQALTTNNQSMNNNRSFNNSAANRSYRDDVPHSMLNRKLSNSESHYDFPADAVEQLKKQQQREESEPRVTPSLLPSNVLKRMNHLNTIFVKPTKIDQALPKLMFQEIDEKAEQAKSLESPGQNERDYVPDDLNRSSSPIFYEKAGLPKLEDEDDENENDDSLNDVRRVRFSTAPIRVYPTYSPREYDRRNEDIDPFAASAEYELEKRIEKMNVFNVEIEKGPDGLGISILGMGVGADSGLEKLGIFVKTLNPDGVIGRDGRIQVGDQIIEVDDHSLVGVTHLYATNVLKNTSGLVRFVVGREKDPGKSEVLGLIQRSLQLDREREEMSRTFEQYHDAYYERDFDEEETDNSKEQKVSNELEMEILKQCYESIEKTLEKTEKEKEHYQQLYEQLQKDFKEMEEKYLQGKLLIKELEDRETEANEQHEKRANELMKKIEELEKIIASKNATGTSSRLPSISIDKMSTYSQQESWPMNINTPPLNFVSSNNKSTDQLDQSPAMNSMKLPSKHYSTPSLGGISNDSDVFTTKTPTSTVPSLEQTNKNEYIEIKDWTPDQCIQWLTAQQMTSLIPLFLTRNINGEKLLVLDGAKMKAMGIKSSKDRDQLKSKIKELKHAELNRAREQLLNQSSASSVVHTAKRLRSSSLTRLKERRFFSSSSGK